MRFKNSVVDTVTPQIKLFPISNNVARVVPHHKIALLRSFCSLADNLTHQMMIEVGLNDQA